MRDPVFGDLNYEYGWNGTVEIDCFGQREVIGLTVQGEEDDPITDEQRGAFKAFMNAWDGIMDDVAEGIFNYYLGLREELGYSEEYSEEYPPVHQVSDILEMISFDLLVIPQDGIFDGMCVCLAFSCSWDDENGIGVRLVDEKIEEIGYQDVAF